MFNPSEDDPESPDAASRRNIPTVKPFCEREEIKFPVDSESHEEQPNAQDAQTEQADRVDKPSLLLSGSSQPAGDHSML